MLQGTVLWYIRTAQSNGPTGIVGKEAEPKPKWLPPRWLDRFVRRADPFAFAVEHRSRMCNAMKYYFVFASQCHLQCFVDAQACYF